MSRSELKLSGVFFCLELEYQEERYEYSETVDHYYDVTRRVVFWSGQARLVDKRSGINRVFLFKTDRFNAGYIGGRFFFSDFARVLFMCKPIGGNEAGGTAVYFSLDMATDRERAIDHLCQKIEEVLDCPSEQIVRSIVMPRVSLEGLRKLGLAPEADGQLRISAVQ